MVPQWSTHVGNNTVLEDDVVFLHKQEELAVAKGLGRKPVAQVSMQNRTEQIKKTKKKGREQEKARLD